MLKSRVCNAGLLFVAVVLPALAHDVITTKLTWNREISRIVYRRCAGCHNGGGAMSLMKYEEARPWAKSIRDQVVARSMPPWGAVKGVGSFLNDPSLTEVEIQMLVAWVEGGAPRGDGEAPRFLDHSDRQIPPAKAVPTNGEFRLDHPLTLLGLRPEGLDERRSMLVDAWLPDGRVEHLIWLRDYRREWTRDYWFRTPMKLPAGTAVHTKAEGPAKVLLLVKDGAARP